MITSSFDRSEAIVTPGAFLGEQKHLCDTAIVTFSREIYTEVLSRYPNEQAGGFGAANGVRALHMLTIEGRKLAFYLTCIGATGAANDMIEANWQTGASRFILFGSAGALDREATAGKYVLPTEAYRDEGMSYHYAPPSDYIRIKNADFLAGVFAKYRLPFVQGRVWTTDAFYRETREQVRRRKAEGCLAVEMELAGVQAVCDFHGWQVYDFLVTGDVVDQPDYTPDGLREANHSMDKFFVALNIAAELDG